MPFRFSYVFMISFEDFDTVKGIGLPSELQLDSFAVFLLKGYAKSPVFGA